VDTIKETLYSTAINGKRKPIHYQSEGSQIILNGIEPFPDLDITEADTALTAIEKLARNKSGANAGVFVTPIRIPTTGWTAEMVGDYPYYADITNENIEEEMMPQLIFSTENCKTARKYGIGETCETLDNKLRVYSSKIPQEEIPAALCLFGEASNINANKLPIASATRAGVVKVGDNIDVTEDGTISVPALADKDGDDVPDIIQNLVPVGADTDETVSDEDINSVFSD